MSTAEVKKSTEQKMQKAFEAFKATLAKLRTGRAHIGVLDHIHVDYYGTSTPLSEERRREIVKVVKHEGENAKVAIRGLRRDANAEFKELSKAKKISEDEDRRGQDEVQKITDRFVAEIDKALAAKEQEIMTV